MNRTPTKAPTVNQLRAMVRRLGAAYSDVWVCSLDGKEVKLELRVVGKAIDDARRKLGVILEGALRALSEEEKQS